MILVAITLALLDPVNGSPLLDCLRDVSQTREQAWVGDCAGEQVGAALRGMESRFDQAALAVGKRVGMVKARAMFREVRPVFGVAPHCPPRAMVANWSNDYQAKLTMLEKRLR